MRVNSAHLSASMLRNINLNSSAMNKLNEQMTLGKRIARPSDDPIGSTRLVQLNREQATINQYQSNITRLSGSLAQQEAHLDAMSKQLLEIRDKVLSASNETNSTEDINGYGAELGAMLDSIVSTLNTQNSEGQYMFGGTKTDRAPIVFDEKSGKYVFQGNTNQRGVAVANGENMTENTNAGDLFFNGSNDLLNELNELVGMMNDPNTDFTSSTYKDALNNIISSTDQSINALTSTLTDIGGRFNRLEMLKDAHEDVKISNELVIKDIDDLDYSVAFVELNGFMLAMQASQKTYVQISRLSLFDVIR